MVAVVLRLESSRDGCRVVVKVYLAGPDVFRFDARELGDRKKAICETHGLEGVFPLDVVPDESRLLAEGGMAIFDICVQMMDECDVAIANMSPFRGPSMDVGTAVELGYLFASGKPVFGYTNSSEDYNIRVVSARSVDGADVEDFGFADNLMCEGVIRRSGSAVIRAPADNLDAFELCVIEAARVLGNTSPPSTT